ncbi:hypothetical protein DPSP01_000220 [Paraphaeosphaeria sporulosa]
MGVVDVKSEDCVGKTEALVMDAIPEALKLIELVTAINPKPFSQKGMHETRVGHPSREQSQLTTGYNERKDIGITFARPYMPQHASSDVAF